MKKLFLLTALIVFSVAAYANRHAVFFWLFTHYFHRPESVAFSTQQHENVKIYFVNSPYFNQHRQEISTRIKENLAKAETALGAKLNSPLTVYLYNDWEEKGNNVRDIHVANAEPNSNTIHCVLNDTYDGLNEHLEYALLFRQRYGAPARPEFLRYTAAAFADGWNQKSLNDWAGFLVARRLLPRFPEFLNSTRNMSEFAFYPWNSIFFRFVKTKFGWNAFVNLYKNGSPPAGFEKPWTDFIASIKPVKITPYVFQPEFQKGVSYAYSNGYDAGYATRKSGRSLDELKALGVNSVAAIPYGFMRGHDQPEIHFAGHDIFGESDESMIALIDTAHKRGMKVMMKPQIWIRHDSWPGNIAFANEADWNSFMQNYENWILHYAILSELKGADLFCVGTEFVQSTLKYPQRWRALIARVREIYHGPLVYAANYGKEFEEIRFWDALDYLGLDNYYPVRASSAEGLDVMKSGFLQQKEKLKAIVLQYHKPLLFTEIGYMANNSAGMGSAEFQDESYNEKMQAECYRLAMETYWNEPWFAGMYWWKWFSDVSDRGKDADAHSPHGRAAEFVLKEWYKRSRS